VAEDVLRIRRFVNVLVRRERLLLALRVAARVALLLVLMLAWGALASVIRVDKSAAVLLLVALAGVGGWVAVAWPLLVDWSSTGDPVRQARRVESLVPDLRGRLITAVEHAKDGQVPESAPLLGLVLRNALKVVSNIAPDQVHPARPALQMAAFTGVIWLLVTIGVVAVGPGDVLRFWFAQGAALAEVALDVPKSDDDLARVGDLVVKYTYPDYTGLPPKVVPNGTGDVSAPPGTTVEISARSATEIEAAGLVAYDERFEAHVDVDRRTLSSNFQVRAEEGTYHLLVYRGGEPEQSRNFTITPEQDLPPDVMLDVGEQEVLELAVNEPIEGLWQARDDYGVRKVGVALNGKEMDKVLERPDRRRSEVGGRLTMSPRDLGLQPGDRVRFSVVAWDNDTISGSKRGESQSVELVVLGASGLDQRTSERRLELLEKMIPILARFLTDPTPPGGTAGEVAHWGEQVAQRYTPLTEAADQLWKGLSTESQDRAIVDSVLESGRKLVRYTQTAFEPASREPLRAESTQMLGTLREGATVALEDAILAFHELLRSEAMREIVEQSDALMQVADQLEQALQEPNADVQELMAKLDQLERMMDQLAEAASRLDESQLKEFLNQRDSEARRMMEEIRQALAENRLDDARKMMERLSQLAREMGQGIRDEVERRNRQAQQAQQDGEDLKAELEQIERDQRQLQSEVQQLQESDRDAANKMAALWAELEKRASEHRKASEVYHQGLVDNSRPFFEQERASSGVEEADSLEQAIIARDPQGARTAVGEAQIAWAGARHALEVLSAQQNALKGPGRQQLGTLLSQLEQIERLLDQLEQAEQQVDPQTLQRARDLESKQRDLDNRLKQANEKAESFEQQFPVRPQGMQEALQDAQQRMQQAADDLQQGQPMQAEGSQGVAAQRIRDAIEAIEQAQQQAQQQSQQMQPGSQQQEGEQQQGEGEQNDRGFRDQELEIPGREEFRTPEEYRRALLEGMEGEVPEEYRSMKQRYFEELVHQ
jgi:hypothetical protein